ncbi:DUF4129 domain-containing protein [Streptomyces sp. NPDC058794]|uniref:DUF4129 domain-containing protein n=1 Tax=Streptomyces sp. NPDC058794 TaxID=3346636 RepID=UPI0036C9A094
MAPGHSPPHAGLRPRPVRRPPPQRRRPPGRGRRARRPEPLEPGRPGTHAGHRPRPGGTRPPRRPPRPYRRRGRPRGGPRALPDHGGRLRAAARDFDDVTYGGRPGTEQSYRRLTELDRDLERSKPQLATSAAGGTADAPDRDTRPGAAE